MKCLFSIFIFMLFVGSSTALAQEEQPPLLILQFGDDRVYQYVDGAATPIETCAANGESLVTSSLWVSPDGWQYAFLTSAPNPGGTANNLRVCDLRTGQLLSITGQPQTRIIHSAPAWSLDGTKLAFARLVQGENRLEFVIYDIATRGQDVMFTRDMPVSSSSLPPQVVWSAVGPIMFNTNITDQARPQVSEYVWIPQEFIVQDVEGEAQVRLLDAFYETMQVITLDDPTMYSIVVSNYNQIGKALDLANNTLVDLPAGSIGTINPAAPDVLLRQVAFGTAPEWTINAPDYSTTLGIPVAPTDSGLAVSSDGSQVAFITFENYPYGGKVYILSDVQAFVMSMGSGELQGLSQVTEFDAHYGQAGAIAVYWGASIPALRP